MLIAAGVLVLAIVAALVMQVDDWSRDLSINYAETSVDAKDPTLRSLAIDASPERVAAAISQFVEQGSAWETGDQSGDEPQTDERRLALVHVSRLFGFADDVVVSLRPTDSGTLVDVTSQSRVGKGDLGQNPRNIRELLSMLRAEFQ